MEGLLIRACLIVLVTCSFAMGDRSLIMNGSFEQNGHYVGDIVTEPPLHWCNVNVPSGKYVGWVGSDWSTHGDYSLTFQHVFFGNVTKGDSCRVSQQVFLANDVEKLIFDLELGGSWDHLKNSAIVKIDDTVIWDSNVVELVSGYFSGIVEVNMVDFGQYLDDDWHEITLAVRANKNYIDVFEYRARWDFVKFDKYCGGLGYLDGDFNLDCHINFADFAMLAENWLDPNAAVKFDLYEDGEVNDLDLMLFAEDWLLNTDWTLWGQQGTYQMELLEADFDLSGQVDLGDIGILSQYWLSNGTCMGIELSGDNIINFKDFAVLAEQLGDKDWFYYLDTD